MGFVVFILQIKQAYSLLYSIIASQVVKRAATLSEVEYADPLPGAGNKRPVRDRLGSSSDSFSSHGTLANYKRLVFLSLSSFNFVTLNLI